MKFLVWIPMLFLVAGCMSISDFSDTVGEGENRVSKRQFRDELQVTLDASDEMPDPERRELLESAASGFLSRIGTGPDAGYLLAEGLGRSRSADDPAGILADYYERAIDTLSVSAVVEADIPENFPEPSAVGLIRVKEYPSVRLAEVRADEAEANDKSMFMSLFRHISDNDIPMTAPVDMSMDGETLSRKSMAFLYESNAVGEPGRNGVVEVRDTKPLTVVSVTVRGGYYDSNFSEAREQLLAWLGGEDCAFEAAGEMRVLGYNSPFVPWFLKLSEVQIPIRERQATSIADASSN